jgi:hypothetical protein
MQELRTGEEKQSCCAPLGNDAAVDTYARRSREGAPLSGIKFREYGGR